MLKKMTKTLRGGGALVLAAVLALSLIPVTKAWAAPIDDYEPDRLISAGEEITASASRNAPLEVVYQDLNGGYIKKATPQSYPYEVETIQHNGASLGTWKVMENGFYETKWFMIVRAVPPSYDITVHDTALEGATWETLPVGKVQSGNSVILNIKPKQGKAFDAPPTVSATGITEGNFEEINGAWVMELTNATGPVGLTLSGTTHDLKYTASLDKRRLENADARLSKTSDITYGETVTLTISPNANHAFTAAPGVSADGADAGPVTAGENGSYTCELTAFTKDAAITVTGQAEEATYTATLLAKDLKGASASLSKTAGIKAGDTVTVTVKPEAGKSFASAPGVVATNAKAGIPAKQADGSYTCAITGFTGNAAVTVTGEAKAADPVKPDIKVSGNGTHVVGAGGKLTFTCPLPLEDLVRVLVDGKVLDKSNYDAKSGSTVVTLKAAYLDTLAEGRHTITLAYTGERAASLGFEVTKVKPLPTDQKGDGSKIAKTGDPLSAAPLAAVAGASGIVLLAGAALRRKMQQ